MDVKPGEIIPYITIKGENYVKLSWVLERIKLNKERNSL